jgi:hypothetical protein
MNSTLDARGHTITAPTLSIGWEVLNNAFGVPTFRVPGDHVVQLLNRGDLYVGDALFVANQNFNLTPTDQVWGLVLGNASTHFSPTVSIERLQLEKGSTATTTAIGNITYGAFVHDGSTLTLGADLNVGRVVGNEFVSVTGNNSILDAQGHKITAWGLSVGYGGTSALLLNRGDLDVHDLFWANQNIDLTPADRANLFTLSNGSTDLGPHVTLQRFHLQEGATATTSAVGNVTQSVGVASGSTLTLGADLNVTEFVNLGDDDSTLNVQGHKITAETLSIGGTGVRLLNKGEITVTNLIVSGQTLNLQAADRVGEFRLVDGSSNLGPSAVVQDLLLQRATVATSSAGNFTRNVYLSDGGTMTLGADLSVSGDITANGDAVTINAQGHTITAETLSLLGNNVRLLNKGNLAVTNLVLVDQDLNLSAADRVTNLTLATGDPPRGSTVSTAATGNVTGNVSVGSHSTLTLGAGLEVTGDVTLGNFNSTIDARGHDITANWLTLWYFSENAGASNVRLLNDGAVTINGFVHLSGGVQIELHDGNDSARALSIGGETTNLRIMSAATGFTLTGTSTDDLLLWDANTLTLELDGTRPGWVFRWANPEGGDHIADLNDLIDQDMILFSVTNGGEFNIVSQNGYTYIIQPVPEPGLILLFVAPVALALCRRRLAGRSLGP